MPPKAKFTREEVIKAALELAREGGEEKVSARELGAKLGSSTRPIFTLFSGMEEVLAETRLAVREVYNGYVRAELKDPMAYQGANKAYIRFATEEPWLFRFLFMHDNSANLNNVLTEIDEHYPVILKSITTTYPVSQYDAKRIYRHLWVYSHGIATMCATKSCSFSESDIDYMLTSIFTALIYQIRRRTANT